MALRGSEWVDVEFNPVDKAVALKEEVRVRFPEFDPVADADMSGAAGVDDTAAAGVVDTGEPLLDETCEKDSAADMDTLGTIVSSGAESEVQTSSWASVGEEVDSGSIVLTETTDPVSSMYWITEMVWTSRVTSEVKPVARGRSSSSCGGAWGSSEEY